MVLRMSTLFVRTRRDDPTDAEVASHRLLVRAGYVRRVGPGIFTWLPLGVRVLANIERIVREEHERIGVQEVHLPALVPREPYETTGRWSDYGESLFRLKDRREVDHLLAPTHEELFTLLVKDLYGSYRDLPLWLFQVQTKFRDELRPRAGVLRGREFLMKDAYSFDVDDAGSRRSYEAFRSAYVRIFDRLGLDYAVVKATSGAMGGSASEEFLALSPAGEDTFVRSEGGSYAANIEAVVTPAPAAEPVDDAPPAQVEDTPDTPTIATLVDHANAHRPRSDGRPWHPADILKNVIVRLSHPDGRRELLAIGLPGDREVDPRRLEASVAPAVVDLVGDDAFRGHPELVKGYIGPGVLGVGKPAGIRYLVDPRVVAGSWWITGADEPGRHVFGLVCGRDFTPDGTIEAAEVRDGDPAPDGSGPLRLARGIEIGHIFQLGRRYAEALDLTVLDERGERVVVTMGSYGIGLSRLVGVIAEQTLDDSGLCWPWEIAPVQVHIVVPMENPTTNDIALAVASQVEAEGFRVLIDDRKRVSAGVKFNDADLLGAPVIVVAGRGVRDGLVEVKDRRTGERLEVRFGDLSERLRSWGFPVGSTRA